MKTAHKSLIFVLSAAVLFALSGSGVNAVGTLIKSTSHKAVYYLAEDGKRYVFPNEKVYLSWFGDFSEVQDITDEQLYATPIGGNVTYKPGAKLVKITTDPKVYAIDKGGVLRWIVSEALAEELYGADWNKQIDDVPDAFFVNYTVGEPVTSATDFNLGQVVSSVRSISDNKGIGATPAEPAEPATPAVPADPLDSATSTPVTPAVPATPATPATPAQPPDSATSTPPVPEPEPEPEDVPDSVALGDSDVYIVRDGFDVYASDVLVGQGGWKEYASGDNYVVKGPEGARVVFVDRDADSVIAKSGNALSDGRQAFSVMTINRNGWGDYGDGNAQFRVSKGTWGGTFAGVTLKPDGTVNYYDPETDAYLPFGSYNDGEWVLIEIEWRSEDTMARYRVNSGDWTEWHVFRGAASFTDFDHVGMDFVAGGDGGAYYDALY